MNKRQKQLFAQLEPSNTPDPNDGWHNEWDKFFMRNSDAFKSWMPVPKDLEEVYQTAVLYWASVIYHTDSKGNMLEGQFSSFHPPRDIIDKVTRYLDPPPVVPIAPYIKYTEGFDKKLPYEVQMHIVRAPIKADVLWAARVWDKQQNSEVPNTRIYAQTLGEVMAEIYLILRQKVPNFGDTMWNAQLDREQSEVDALADHLDEEADNEALCTPVRFSESGAAEA